MTIPSGMPANPYVGPRSFTRDDPLFGRDVERVNLLNLLLSERIVLLFSPSGAGKTSLIQAGVIPALEAEKFRPLPIIRVNRAPSSNGGGAATNRYVASALYSLAEGAPNVPDLGLADLSGITMSEYLDRLDGGRESPSDATSDPVVLIFDQFEEILTADPTDLAAKTTFFAQVGEALRAPHRWALFSMREEYVAALDPYVRLVPTRLETTFRLGLLEQAPARDAIQKPAEGKGVDFTDAAASALVQELVESRLELPDGMVKEISLPFVEPVQLQVVCTRFWERLPWTELPVVAGRPQIEQSYVAQFARVDDALADYYDAKLATISGESGAAPVVLEREIREWIDSNLITERGMRAQLRAGAEEGQSLPDAVIQALIDAYLIRREGRRGDTWFELAHDRLVEPIMDSNARWLKANLAPVQIHARQWDETGRRPESLFRGGDLRLAQGWANANLAILPTWEQSLLTDFLGDSMREQRSRVLRVVAALAFIGLIVAFGLVYVRTLEARRDAAEAEQASAEQQSRIHLTEAFLSQALFESGRGEHERAALLARQAFLLDQDAGGPSRDRVDTALRQTLDVPHFSTVLRDDKGWLLPVAFNPDGTILTTAGQNGTILLQSLDDPGASPTRLGGDAGPVRALAFSPEGDRLASGGDDGRIRLWDPAQPGTDPAILGEHEGAVWSLAFAPGGKLLASGGDDGAIRLWHLDDADSAPIVLSGDAHWVNPVAISPDGQLLASGGNDGTVRLWNLTRPEYAPLMLIGHEEAVRAVAFAPNGRLLATGGFDNTIRLWNLGSSNPEARVFSGHEGTVTSVAFTSDGSTLASSSLDDTIRLWNPSDSQAAPEILTGHQGAVRALAIAPDGRYLASTGANGTARRWALLPHVVATRILRAHVAGVTSVAFSPDGTRLASASQDNTIRVWDTNDYRAASISLTGHRGTVSSVSFSADSRFLFSAGYDGTLRRWSLASRKEDSPRLTDYDGRLYDVAVSPDGKWLAAGALYSEALIWNLARPSSPLKTLDKLGGAVLSVAFSPDSRLLVSGSSWAVGIIDLANLEAEPVFLGMRAIRAITVSPDGQLLASASGDDGTVQLRNLTDLDAGPLPMVTGEEKVWTLAFSLDGRLLATGSGDGLIRLWDFKHPERDPIVLRGHEGAVYSVAFSPDGRRLASGEPTEPSDCGRLTHQCSPTRSALWCGGT